MNTSSKYRLASIFVLTSLSTGVIIGFIVNSVITNRVIYETQERVKEALNTARWVYNSKLSDIDRTIRLTSIRYILKEALRKEKALSGEAYLRVFSRSIFSRSSGDLFVRISLNWLR